MSRESELKGIIEDLKNYLEFEKSMGVGRVSVIKEAKEEPPPKPQDREPARAQMKAPVKTEKKEDVIKVEQQIGIFDASAKRMTLEEIRAEIGDCTRCKLSEGRTNIVFGEGNPKARLVFVGEGPGRDEDLQGRPFVGRAGQLLNKIIEAMGLKREDVYICNVVKCRPPDNRTPEPDEMATCEQFLFKQIRSIEPQVIVCLGSTAAQSVLKSKLSLGSLRGKFHQYGRAKLMVTYHPAALLRNPNFKKPLWEDMQVVMKELGISRPGD
ncbi:MAG: uracil-DNA glycosylase [Thermodesulfobacteriota bacterium]